MDIVIGILVSALVITISIFWIRSNNIESYCHRHFEKTADALACIQEVKYGKREE